MLFLLGAFYPGVPVQPVVIKYLDRLVSLFSVVNTDSSSSWLTNKTAGKHEYLNQSNVFSKFQILQTAIHFEVFPSYDMWWAHSKQYLIPIKITLRTSSYKHGNHPLVLSPNSITKKVLGSNFSTPLCSTSPEAYLFTN